MDKWSVADLNKMINWKKFEADGATPERKKDLLVLWDLIRGRPKPTPPKRFEEYMHMDGSIYYDVKDDLCKFGDQNQVTSFLICIFCVDRVDIL